MSLWERLRTGLSRTREQVVSSLGGVLSRSVVDPATLERLEEALLLADVGPATTSRLIETARSAVARAPGLDLGTALERAAAGILSTRRASFAPNGHTPWVALVIGVNGVGKTTLAGKLAAHFAREGRRTRLVAADTFRAAAGEQLGIWAERAGVDLTRAGDGADPAAVVHDGITAAVARGNEVVLVDTAGRLHTKHNLMAELEKVGRVCARLVPDAPHHTLLVLDATIGQNGLQQAREFQRVMPITSL
ncbi:MAG TPA: signaling recognition particle receptor family protein, partial [Dongiaceae bacterium]|nr:signaling recognition particle receptor family protein [Dongiaceae bacterium]